MDDQAKSDLLHKLTYGLYVLTSAEGGERGGKGCQPDPAGPQTREGRELGLGGVETAEDLLRALGQHPPGLGEPDPTADPLDELAACLGLQPGQVGADRRLRVPQGARRGRHRAVSRDRHEHPQPGYVQHAGNVSISLMIQEEI